MCEVCKLRHPTSLHDAGRMRREPTKDGVNDECSHFAKGADTRVGNQGQCTMAIVPVQVRLKNSVKTVCTYAFLDPGSTVSFCSESLARQLGASGPRKEITLDTMGRPFSMTTSAIDGLQVYDLDFVNQIYLRTVYTKDKIPVSRQHIPTTKDLARWDHLKKIVLPRIESEVGLLLGNNVADAYTPFELRTGGRGAPHAAKTAVGWVVWNLVKDINKQAWSSNSCSFVVNRAEVTAIRELEEMKRLDKLVRDTINLDFPERLSDDVREYSQEDKRFLEAVNKTVVYENGHYCIGLPFKSENVKLPDNKAMASKRLESLKRKLEKNQEFARDYKEFMTKIISSGYAEMVPTEDLNRTDGRTWYIPHHGVYHPCKPNKIRVVFDCAATYLGTSLNSVLLQGPDLTNSLVGVLLRFRQDEIAIMGDIEAMFFQVTVPKEDRDCLCFLWWPNGNVKQQPVTYRMNVHTFGAVSSPSCASFALKLTADTYGGDQASAETVRKSFYVDYCLASVGTVEEACSLIKSTTNLCGSGGFRLTKWASSDRRVVLTVPIEERAKELKELMLDHQELPDERALGVYWLVEPDCFSFKINIQSRPATRRGILSIASSIYDPLGIAAQFTLRAKILMQSLCRRRIKWDEEIQGDDLKRWRSWLNEVTGLNQVRVRRCYKPQGFGRIACCQLHMFADASDVGYGVAAYLRLTNGSGKICCSLVMGKARVAPLKRMTIPRMELTASAIAVKFARMITKELDLDIHYTYYWTDSMTVLRYLANETTRFQTFVANRIATIRDGSSIEQWRYVNTKVNPADCASRGLSLKNYLQSSLWFEGPSFLIKKEAEWPQQIIDVGGLHQDDREVKECVMLTSEENQTLVDRMFAYYSSWISLKKAVAWMLVGMKNLKDRVAARRSNENMEIIRTQETIKPLTIDDVKDAERAIVRYVQKEHWASEMSISTETEKEVKISSLKKLDPKLINGLLRVGGRISKANQSFESKDQILLPKSSIISKLMLEHLHISLGHLGKNAILAELRQKYWITGAPAIIKGIIAKCVACRRYQAPLEKQKMADLPPERLAVGEPPFSNVGADYFGPFEIKQGRSIVKRYGVIFTCMTTRAVHLELAHSLETSSCINAIRRLVARRGIVKKIRSDNGTNLVGAERELKEELKRWNQQKIHDTLMQKGITWQFNPPAASHFGGAWERLIRSVRKILYSLLREQNIKLSDESLQTLFCEVEAIMNGRPLTVTPNSPKDLDVLTPNHVLLLRAGESAPLGLFTKSDNYSTKRWRQVQYIADMFWRRFIREYIPLLQARQKWFEPKRNIAVGDVVLVMDTTPRNSWALGKVLEVHVDAKGLARSVQLKTKSGTLVHPVAKLCLLVENNS